MKKSEPDVGEFIDTVEMLSILALRKGQWRCKRCGCVESNLLSMCEHLEADHHGELFYDIENIGETIH